MTDDWPKVGDEVWSEAGCGRVEMIGPEAYAVRDGHGMLHAVPHRCAFRSPADLYDNERRHDAALDAAMEAGQ